MSDARVVERVLHDDPRTEPCELRQEDVRVRVPQYLGQEVGREGEGGRRAPGEAAPAGVPEPRQDADEGVEVAGPRSRVEGADDLLLARLI